LLFVYSVIHRGLLVLFPETTGMHQEGKLVPLLADAGAVASASASA